MFDEHYFDRRAAIVRFIEEKKRETYTRTGGRVHTLLISGDLWDDLRALFSEHANALPTEPTDECVFMGYPVLVIQNKQNYLGVMYDTTGCYAPPKANES